MPLYAFQCRNQECGHRFDAASTQEGRNDARKCPECACDAVRTVAFRRTATTFTEKIYPFFHQGIGEVVHSESQLNKRCAELNFYSKHEGAYMTPKHERKILAQRVDQRPRHLVEKVRWSGKGANLPTFETFDTETGCAPEQESLSE